MRKIALLFLMMAICAAATSADGPSAQTVPVVGLDDQQHAFVKWVPLATYMQTLQSGVAAVQDSVIPVLQKQEEDAAQAPARHLRLQTLAVGLSLTGTIGIGPIWSITATPRFRLIFTRSKNPIYPVYN